MKLTEKVLLDGYKGKTNGGSNISQVEGKKIFWDYRTGIQEDGYNPVTSRERAGEVTLEYDRIGTIALDSSCQEHPALARIAHHEAEMWGTEAAHA